MKVVLIYRVRDWNANSSHRNFARLDLKFECSQAHLSELHRDCVKSFVSHDFNGYIPPLFWQKTSIVQNSTRRDKYVSAPLREAFARWLKILIWSLPSSWPFRVDQLLRTRKNSASFLCGPPTTCNCPARGGKCRQRILYVIHNAIQILQCGGGGEVFDRVGGHRKELFVWARQMQKVWRDNWDSRWSMF